MIKECIVCKNKLEHNRENFYPQNKENKFRSICRKCYIKKRNIYFSSNLKQHLSQLLRSRKRKCKYKSNVNIEDLLIIYDKQKGKCLYTGIQMTYKNGSGYNPNNISIDRINNNKGYDKDNIQLVCAWANLAKHVVNHKEFIQYCKLVSKNPNLYK